MAHDSDVDMEHLSPGGLKYSAGTPNASGPIGMAAAIRYIRDVGFPSIVQREQAVIARMQARLADMPRVRLLGAARPTDRIGVFSFVVVGRLPLSIMNALDQEGIAVRAGDLASLPLRRRLGVSAAVRASCYVYTTTAEVDRFCDVLARAIV